MMLRTLTRLGLTVAVAVALPLTASAQTWQWQVPVRTPNGTNVATQSRVELHGDRVSLAFVASIHDRNVSISSCTVDVADIANVAATDQSGRTYLIVQLKPQRRAQCENGPQGVAMTPIVRDAQARDATAVLTRACCAASVAQAPRPSPAPSISPAPAPSPSPAVTRAPAVVLDDWVEVEGLFAFVRVRNRDRRNVQIDGSVGNCRNVASGCGPFPHGVSIGPGDIATVATVMSAGPASATFTYRYDATAGTTHATDGGPSTKSAPPGIAPMSAADQRTAEAAAIALLRGAPPAAAPSPSALPTPGNADVQLLHRGESRLAIGQKGEAMLRVAVAADGTPQSAVIVRTSNPKLSAAAIETAISSTYKPAVKNGRAVAATYIATFDFDGDDPALAGIPLWKRDPATSDSPAPAH